MIERERHLNYIERHGRFVIDCKTDALTPEEIIILEKWGYWMEGLFKKELAPITKKQAEFIRVAKREMEPETIYQTAWRKYLEQKERESKREDI